MIGEQTNAIRLCGLGLFVLLVNKPFGELCLAWDKQVFGRDLGIRSFRIPIIAIGAAMLALGVWLLLS